MDAHLAHPYTATVSVPGSTGIGAEHDDFGLRWQSEATTPLSTASDPGQSGVALRFPPQSKKFGCGFAATSHNSRRMVAVYGCTPCGLETRGTADWKSAPRYTHTSSGEGRVRTPRTSARFAHLNFKLRKVLTIKIGILRFMGRGKVMHC